MFDPQKRRILGAGAIAIAIIGVLVGLVVQSAPRPDPVTTDRLGPDYGESVTEYRARADVSLSGDDGTDHWALVSFTDYPPATALPQYRADLRISRVLYEVPIPRVSTPLVDVQVPDNDEALLRSADDAASQLMAQRQDNAAPDERTNRVLDLSSDRLHGECACVAGLIVRAPLSVLSALTERDQVRAVQALPADAVAGSFAVMPLRPGDTDFVAPVPDDGPVPQR